MKLFTEDTDARRFALEAMEMEAEELRIWREKFPRSAADIREMARAKIEGRNPR